MQAGKGLQDPVLDGVKGLGRGLGALAALLHCAQLGPGPVEVEPGPGQVCLVSPATVSALRASYPELTSPAHPVPPHSTAQAFTAHSPLHKLQAPQRAPSLLLQAFYPGQPLLTSLLGIHLPYIH